MGSRLLGGKGEPGEISDRVRSGTQGEQNMADPKIRRQYDPTIEDSYRVRTLFLSFSVSPMEK
jgi:hypothetical protein